MGPSASASLLPLTRKAFFELAVRCRRYADELARFDQSRVNLAECHRFNQWLAQVRRYDKLQAPLRAIKQARPIARWQLLVLLSVLNLMLLVALPGRVDRTIYMVAISSAISSYFLLFLVPESWYGTTVEMIEGKILKVVETLEAIHTSGELEFTEAVWFQAKEHLTAARSELRQQIDLAHR